ncbi:hypothetical protein ACHAXH_002165 [Discostella pseudostelligera]
MSANNFADAASCRGGNNRWAPLSYPSASIFASMPSRENGCDQSDPFAAARVANPFFPLHRDVLFAAMRDLLIIDGKIDYRTMEMISPSEWDSSNIAGDGSTATEAMNLDTHSNTTAHESQAIALSSDDEGKDDDCSSLKKKRRIQDTSVDSLPTLHEQKELHCSQNHPHIVPIAEHFDYARFWNAEALVSYAVDRAITHVADGHVPSNQLDNSHTTNPIQSTVPPTSKRKVSDAEDLSHDHVVNDLDFPSEILSLVRSNIMLLQTSPSGSALTKLTTQSGIEYYNSNTATNSEETDHAILSFLRHPKSQREQQQQGKLCQTRFVLPQLLEVSIDDECSLRAKAHRMILSMVNSIPGNDMNTPLRAFLGYKSTKSPCRDRIVEIISDVLFDVSHAMYAWIHTHDKLLRSQGKDGNDTVNCISMDLQIKASLFDERALKRIGGFEPESLLPLALGIRRCRLANISWEQYVITDEGRMAMNVHSNHQVGFLGEQNDGEENMYTSRRRKRHATGTIMVHNSLLELGKKRRGRRGKSVQSSRL